MAFLTVSVISKPFIVTTVKKITAETRKPYGRAVGTGTIIIGASILGCAIVEWLVDSEWAYVLPVIGCIVGLGFILYGQFKYNKGLF